VSANDMYLIVEMLPEKFNIYHLDMDEWTDTARRGRPVARRLSLSRAIEWSEEQAAEYGYRIRLLSPEKRRLLG